MPSKISRAPYRIIAIDPGYGRVGIAVLEKDGGGEPLVFSECFETSVKESRPTRLAEIQTRLREIIRDHKPSALAIEKLFFSRNRKTALAVAEARGIITGEAAAQGLPVFEYNPMDIKIAVTGYGRADKQQIKLMIDKLLKISKSIERDDEYDAIAVGLTHLAIYHP